jgi:predicted nuclease of restriction endonuclease-like RecB superfamily
MHEANKPIPLPEGYDSWLEYAVATFDASAAELIWLFDDNISVSSDEIRKALWADLNDLRRRAGLPPMNPVARHRS